MWALAKALSNASVKLVATFFMVILLMLLGLVAFPSQLNQLNDFANYVANWAWIRNPDIPEQGKFLFRTLVNESTVFGILTTLIARAVVEVLFYLFGVMWHIANREPEGSHGSDVSVSAEGSAQVMPERVADNAMTQTHTAPTSDQQGDALQS